jgi:hypothetical protein
MDGKKILGVLLLVGGLAALVYGHLSAALETHRPASPRSRFRLRKGWVRSFRPERPCAQSLPGPSRGSWDDRQNPTPSKPRF